MANALLLAAGGAAAGVVVGGPVGAAIGAGVGLLLGMAGKTEQPQAFAMPPRSVQNGGASRLAEILDPDAERFPLPWRFITWEIPDPSDPNGTISIQPSKNALGWSDWLEDSSAPLTIFGQRFASLLAPVQSSSRVLRAYRVAKGCSPIDSTYAKWSRWAVGFENARKRIQGLDQSLRQKAVSALVSAGARGWRTATLSETENYWASIMGDDADWFLLSGAMGIPVSVALLDAPLTQGQLTALIRVTQEPATNCSIYPGRGMSCNEDLGFMLDETDFLCKGKPGIACSSDVHPDRTPKAVFDAQGVCNPTVYLPGPTPESATEYRREVVQDGRRQGESLLDCIERLGIPKACQTMEKTITSSSWSCNPGFRVSDDGRTCVSEAIVCPEGQVLGSLGTCVTPQQNTSAPTGETVGGVPQFSQPTVEGSQAGNITTPVASIPSPILAPITPGSFNLPPVPPPILPFRPIQQTPPLTIKPLSGAVSVSRLANMGIGLPRGRG